MKEHIVYTKKKDLPSAFKEFLSIPFIYGMFIPIVILDIFAFVYQHVAFRLYGIPIVKWSDYVTFERKDITFLGIFDKFNCIYCSYVNGVLAYVREIGARTEKYWCPVKRSDVYKVNHSWEKYFADKNNAEDFFEQFRSNKQFFNEKYHTEKPDMHSDRACTHHLNDLLKHNQDV